MAERDLRGFRAWVDSMDPSIRTEMLSPGTWLGVTVCAGIVIGIAGFVPGARELFRLQPLPAVLCFLPTVTLGLGLGLLERRNRLSSMAFGLGSTIGSTVFQFFMWSLVALSELPGATMMASLPIFLASFHGHAFRSSPQHPYIAIATVIAVAGAAAINHEPGHLAIYGLGAPIAAAMSLVLGHISLGNRASELRTASMREAVDAQILREQTRQMESVSQALLKLQGTSHDAGSALSSVLFNLEQLTLEARRLAGVDPQARSLADMADGLQMGLERLRGLLEEARRTGSESRPNLEMVDVELAIRLTLDELAGALSGVGVTIAGRDREGASAPSERIAVPIYGGIDVLRRILTNLLTNAAQGNGSRAARQVEVQVLPEREPGAVVVRVRDDGPGFSATLLDYPIRAFHSTKPGGTGLGLYTTEQLVTASGGSLKIANRTDGSGAQVDLVLKRQVPA